ncbi:hypothetical protein GCM10027275_47400 [Rhabdobacter roseus]|uniref:Outer membrane protein OmpA-like peptidoglycan-associated protein n=1 Tax=Rhabdobacter roseus TaxID=1655419 RepID=A0A840U2N0_9BACT|nr:OmpA family protein [Rhabdobacter roseus]MBB5286380.1 outer membrane protein OmpA-like peptidoglycan-associated protein [Rhabdobacter roseus]
MSGLFHLLFLSVWALSRVLPAPGHAHQEVPAAGPSTSVRVLLTLQAFDKSTQRTLPASFEVRERASGRITRRTTTAAEPEFVLTLTRSDSLEIVTTALGYLPLREIIGVVADATTDRFHTYWAFLDSTTTQSVSLVAVDDFTRKPIPATFVVHGPGADSLRLATTAKVPTAAPVTLSLRQPYTVAAQASGYQPTKGTFTLEKFSAGTLPQLVLMSPLHYEVMFLVLDANSQQRLPQPAFSVVHAGRVMPARQVSQGVFLVRLPADEPYEIRASLPGYDDFEQTQLFKKPSLPDDLKKFVLLNPAGKVPARPAPTAAAPAQVPTQEVFSGLAVGEVVRLDRVYFNQSSYELRRESFPQLDQLARTLKQNLTLKIELAGHTDNVGDARLNQSLSENRARVIANYLRSQGIASERLLIKGYGSTRPVAPNDSEENRAQNRRVEFVVLSR